MSIAVKKEGKDHRILTVDGSRWLPKKGLNEKDSPVETRRLLLT